MDLLHRSGTFSAILNIIVILLLFLAFSSFVIWLLSRTSAKNTCGKYKTNDLFHLLFVKIHVHRYPVICKFAVGKRHSVLSKAEPLVRAPKW